VRFFLEGYPCTNFVIVVPDIDPPFDLTVGVDGADIAILVAMLNAAIDGLRCSMVGLILTGLPRCPCSRQLDISLNIFVDEMIFLGCRDCSRAQERNEHAPPIHSRCQINSPFL